MTQLSAIIITKNEEENIARCLESVKFADEVVVVDSGSTDKTTLIAREHGARVFVREFDNFAAQRNYAVSKTTGEWILSLDADEVIPSKLAAEIKQVLLTTTYDGYLLPRKNIIFGAEIKHSRWSPDKHIWLFRKAAGKFVGDIHEEVQLDGPVGELKNAKLHYSHKDVASFMQMLNTYTSREADAAVSAGRHFSYFQLFWRPKLAFFRRFIYKLGFLDGWRGFMLAYLMAIYRFTTEVKIWERQKAH